MQTIDFLHDIRCTLRQLGKNPGFAPMVVLTLTLGIGANTSIFSVVNAVLLTPLPIADADEVVIVSETVRREITEMRAVSYPDFLDWREQNAVFEDIVAFYGVSFTLTRTDGASRIQGELVSGSYFDLLGIEPRFGRAFLPEKDETPDTHPVTVISHGLWQRSFGGTADIIWADHQPQRPRVHGGGCRAGSLSGNGRRHRGVGSDEYDIDRVFQSVPRAPRHTLACRRHEAQTGAKHR